uniref:Uncharacterized protein n=1 Tax=Arundo donax TaxID=35708 RepID=A0A0A9AG14_ARUDO
MRQCSTRCSGGRRAEVRRCGGRQKSHNQFIASMHKFTFIIAQLLQRRVNTLFLKYLNQLSYWWRYLGRRSPWAPNPHCYKNATIRLNEKRTIKALP